ncbi:MAG: RNA polymerase sigma factor, partial [Acidimicrobiales bacterium]
AWRHASVFDPRLGTVERWVLTIAKNLSIDAVRRRRAVPLDPLAIIDLAAASSDSSLDDRVEHGDRRARVVVALGRLPEEQRRAVVLATLHGRTALEISEIEGIPLGTSKTRIRTGLSRLRDHLAVMEDEPR